MRDESPPGLPFYSHRDWNPDGTLKEGAHARALARVEARYKGSIAVPWTRQVACAEKDEPEEYAHDPREEGGIEW